MTIKYLPHTADVKFEVTADSLEDAFSESGRAVTGVMTEEAINEARLIDVDCEGSSLESLLFAFLDEVILLLDTEGFFVARAEVNVSQANEKWFLSGKLIGDDAVNYARHGDVKAPTWHDIAAKRVDDKWVFRATLDI